METIRDSYFFKLLSLYGMVLEFAFALFALFFISPLIGVFVVIMAVAQLLMPVVFQNKVAALGDAHAQAQEHYMIRAKEIVSSG